MFANTREPDVSPCSTAPSRPKSMNADFRVPERDVSFSLSTNPPVGGISSVASGWSSTSWPAAVVAVSKSGSSSSGGTSTTGFRAGRAGTGGGAIGRFGVTGLTFGGPPGAGLRGIVTRGGDPTPGRDGGVAAGAAGAFGWPGRLGTTGETGRGAAVGGVPVGKPPRLGGAARGGGEPRGQGGSGRVS